MSKLQLNQTGSGFSKPLLLSSTNSHFFNHVHRRIYISYKPRTDHTSIALHRKAFGDGVITKRFNVISNVIRPSTTTDPEEEERTVTVKAVINARLNVGGLLSNLTLTGALDFVTDLVGRTILLELVSSELEPDTRLEKKNVKGYGHKVSKDGEELKLEGSFDVPESFGDIGAVLVQNEYHKEMYLKDIVLTVAGSSNAPPITITCNSWINSKYDDSSQMRIFFTNKSYLPSETPRGLKKLREKELENLRGDGKGERKSSDRIYDYDKYNDLGVPDSSDELARPVLGGTEHPYPRRCRTGRAPSEKDPLSEKRSLIVYVPRDEAFSEPKELQFSTTIVEEVLHALVPSFQAALLDNKLGFPHFTAIDNIFNQGVKLPKLKNQGSLRSLFPRLVASLSQIKDDLLRFDTPEIFNRNRFSWLEDEEFSRQTLAGVNPYSIQLVTEWPLKSKLDPNVYGPCECSITKELLEREIKGIMTVDEALEQKKLFILDYHDLLLPFVKKVRALEGTTLYGSRTIFFLTPDSTLRLIAIELTRPPMDYKPQWKKVFTPGYNATTCWLWKFAKVHVGAHDSGYHELVIHWLRTHCCLEPYIIATNRQLSAMHPIYRLLHPHLRYTMEINVRARLSLINAGGIIEQCFSPGKYSMELSSAAYDQIWRFDMEALPADLIRRGMAVEDPTAPHGLKLTIQDYPFANDGLLVWDAIKSWISDYVSHYYSKASLIETDSELQAWWTEIRTKGHEDKKNESWWPKLKDQDDLIQILTTIVWVASCHHAAVNFSQYTYGGYFPNRPSIARTNMPTEDMSREEHKLFMEKPESVLMKCFPSQIQAPLVMAVLRLLSTHSMDEEYLGDRIEPSWDENPHIKEAFERFNKKLIEVGGIIDARNADPKLLNRTGAGVVPYELLKPFSEPGMTGMGVPNSTSI
ncbi:Lipoxygenase 2 protein [Thalictrum thalictroides]|uniref:Lipoxygenase n=1 Tax=Thalictrum thalictroides TaxID=46969 RepID=A0A7J6WC69_THATH|nr:Lipoxygenase 2 protein [Thalictrum thalictroides]